MVVVSSGPISLASVATEFGDSAPHNLADFYRTGSYVVNTNRTQGIPSSGSMPLTSFYGASSTYTTNTVTNSFSMTVYQFTVNTTSYYSLPSTTYNSTQVDCTFRCFLKGSGATGFNVSVEQSLGGGQIVFGPGYAFLNNWTDLGRYVGPAAQFRLRITGSGTLTSSSFQMSYKY